MCWMSGCVDVLDVLDVLDLLMCGYVGCVDV
jgi:hypothetical protein